MPDLRINKAHTSSFVPLRLTEGKSSKRIRPREIDSTNFPKGVTPFLTNFRGGARKLIVAAATRRGPFDDAGTFDGKGRLRHCGNRLLPMRAAMNERASSFRGSATCPALRGDERDSSCGWTRSAIRDQQITPDKYAEIAFAFARLMINLYFRPSVRFPSGWLVGVASEARWILTITPDARLLLVFYDP